VGRADARSGAIDRIQSYATANFAKRPLPLKCRTLVVQQRALSPLSDIDAR
jgi:hypothetical protein